MEDNQMKRISILALLVCICLVSDGWLQGASKLTIIKFNAPGAGKSKGQGTEPLAINKAGAIAGFYLDSGRCRARLPAVYDRRFHQNKCPGRSGHPT
jgi:hypothetical protein